MILNIIWDWITGNIRQCILREIIKYFPSQSNLYPQRIFSDHHTSKSYPDFFLNVSTDVAFTQSLRIHIWSCLQLFGSAEPSFPKKPLRASRSGTQLRPICVHSGVQGSRRSPGWSALGCPSGTKGSSVPPEQAGLRTWSPGDRWQGGGGWQSWDTVQAV